VSGAVAPGTAPTIGSLPASQPSLPLLAIGTGAAPTASTNDHEVSVKEGETERALALILVPRLGARAAARTEADEDCAA
jgi:hypothetical protein